MEEGDGEEGADAEGVGSEEAMRVREDEARRVKGRGKKKERPRKFKLLSQWISQDYAIRCMVESDTALREGEALSVVPEA